MRLLVIIIFIILAGPLIRAQTISHDSLEGTKWILTSIDSAGTILTMPINPHYFVYFNAFENSKWKYKRRYKKIVRKYGYKEMAVFTEETNRSSKYFCQIRGLYKIS